MNWLSKALKVIGKITDVLIKGRQAGLWTEKPGIGTDPRGKPHDPTIPDTRYR